MLSNYNFFLKQVALAMGTISCILTIFIGIWPRFNCSCMWGCCLFASIAWGFSSIILQSPNQKIPDRKTKCVIKTHINIKQNVIFGAKLKPV